MKNTKMALVLIRTLSFSKIWNALLVLASYHISRILKRPIQWGYPISVAIEPTTACNLGCPECPSGLKEFTRATGNLKTEFFEQFLSSFHNKSAYLTFYFQGEPYIHPHFLDLVRMATQRRWFVSTSTNAHFLGKEAAKKTVSSGLQRTIISIDGSTQEVYEQYRRGGDLSKVIEGTRNLVEAKKAAQSATPHIIIQFLVVKPNEHQMDDMKAMARELGVDEIRFKSAQINEFKNGSELIPENKKYARYKKLKDGTWALKNRFANHCWRLWSSCVVTWDGRVVPCCFDKDASYNMGEMNQDSFPSIWWGTRYKKFRQKLLGGRKHIDICANCSEGTKVWIDAA